jgi:hypothetical protein
MVLDTRDSTTRSVPLWQNGIDRTDWTGQKRDRTSGTGHLEKDSSDRTSEAGQTGQVGLTGQPVQEREERTARR